MYAPENVTTSEHAADAAAAVEEPMRILVVDDEESILWSLSQNLSLACTDYRVGTASSAEEALTILERTDVDVLITDLRLPQMDGLALIERVQELSPDTRSILMTAYGSDSVFSQTKDTGGFAYVEKPFSFDLLLRYIAANQGTPEISQLTAEFSNMSITDLLKLTRNRGEVYLEVFGNNSSGLVIVQDGVIRFAEFDGVTGVDALLLILSIAYRAVERPAELFAERLETCACSEVLNVDIAALDAVTLAKTPLQQASILRTHVVKEPDPDDTLTRIAAQVMRGEKNEAQQSEPKQPATEDVDLSLAPDPYEAAQADGSIDDFTFRDLLLQSECRPDNEYRRDRVDEARIKKAAQLVNAGVNYFREHELEKARHCWKMALHYDPNARAAQTNLQILESVLNPKTC